MKPSRFDIALLVLLLSPLCAGQSLTLFEDIEAEDDTRRPAGPRSVQDNRAGQPVFTLRSVSRFGDRYSSVLVDADGEAHVLDWQAGQQVSVPGSGGFAITGIEGGELTLRHPASNGCITAPDAGVHCLDSQTAVLSLTPATPLADNGSQQAQTPRSTTTGMPFLTREEEQALTPAERALRRRQAIAARFNSGDTIRTAAGEVVIVDADGDMEDAPRIFFRNRAGDDPAGGQRGFVSERIAEEDAPPGMRVVRTPFGDRLVPIRQ